MAASAPPVATAESAGEGPVAAVVVVVDVDVHVWVPRRSRRHGGLGGRGDGRSARWPVKPPADQLERRGVANATDGHRLAGPATPAAVEGAAALAGRARWRGRSGRARHGGRGGWQRRRPGAPNCSASAEQTRREQQRDHGDHHAVSRTRDAPPATIRKPYALLPTECPASSLPPSAVSRRAGPRGYGRTAHEMHEMHAIRVPFFTGLSRTAIGWADAHLRPPSHRVERDDPTGHKVTIPRRYVAVRIARSDSESRSIARRVAGTRRRTCINDGRSDTERFTPTARAGSRNDSALRAELPATTPRRHPNPTSCDPSSKPVV